MAEQTLAEAIAENRATNPRLEQQAAPMPEPTPEPTPEPQPEPTPEPVAAEPDQAPEPDGEPKPDTPPVKAKRTAVEVLTGRVGQLTKNLSTTGAQLAAERARADAAEALLNARGNTPQPEGEAASAPILNPATVNPATGRTYTEAEFNQAVAAKADADAFNRQADQMYENGSTKFNDWKEKVDLLNATGLMTKDLLDAAMATDAGADVIHHLGTDVDEAQRIAALPPIRMAAEMTKLATKLNAPAAVRVSGAPAPISRINGAVNPVIDLDRASAGDNDMSEYRAARAKQGARWAQAKGQREAR